MNNKLKNPYSEARNYLKPVIDQSMPKDTFMHYVRNAVEDDYTRSKVILNNHRMYANILEYYLEKYDIKEIVPDEEFFNTMWDRLMADAELNGRQYSIFSRKKVARTVRKIVNSYFLARRLVNREVLIKKVIQRYEKFFALTPNSQEAILWFENNGKLVQAQTVAIEGKDGLVDHSSLRVVHRLTNKDLLPISKSGKIDHALRLLHIVGKKGFEQITREDVKKLEDYCSERNVIQTQDYLAHTASFFINIKSQGFVKDNPFGDVSLKMAGGAVRKEFISTESMQRLRDLSTVNFKDKIQVRDRLFALLAYDLALRLNEVLGLKLTDVRKDSDGDWLVTLKSEVQKGQNKDEQIMYFFFDETKQLLEVYLNKSRKEFFPETDFLFISNYGTALNSQHCRNQFQRMCSGLSVTTFSGTKPSPHVLRHSFATINIEPLGLSLPLYEMAQRLRHARVETTRKHYIHNNPYLQKIKLRLYRNKVNKRNSRDVLNEIPLADLEHWLSDKLNLESSIVKSIRTNHKKTFNEAQADQQGPAVTKYISEADALDMIKHLCLAPVALRQYAKAHKMLEKGFIGTCRFGTGFRFNEEFINDLSKNWLPRKFVQTKLKLSPRAFQRLIKKERWRVLRIGKYRLIHKNSVL